MFFFSAQEKKWKKKKRPQKCILLNFFCHKVIVLLTVKSNNELNYSVFYTYSKYCRNSTDMAVYIWQTALLIRTDTVLTNGWFMMIIFIMIVLYFTLQYQLNFIQRGLMDQFLPCKFNQAIKCSHSCFPQPWVFVYELFKSHNSRVSMKCDMTYTAATDPG